MSPPPSPSSPATARARSPARRCVRTAVWFCVELGAVGDQVGAEQAVGVAPAADLLQAPEVGLAQEAIGATGEVGVAQVDALADGLGQSTRVARHPVAVALVVG